MIQIQNIAKQYKTGDLVQKALNDVSFTLRDNEFVSILGPSGSGKTTLLNIIGGLDRYDSGDLIINGTSTKKYKNRDWDTYRNHTIGFVFQSYNLIPHQSILSNVELALTIGGVSARERKKRAKEALEEVGLKEHIHKKPNQLSGGQMQRVAIARALVNDPDILLADEPTGALDSETSVQIMDLLKKVANKRLVVMVTHNGELAEEYSTRIIRLKDGKIVSDTNPVSEEERKKGAPAGEDAAKNKIKNARMSFLTCLALSANNLKSKKGRTILISLACSIGIIGIALILSVSTGVNDYILNMQKDTMSSYPLTISAQTMDLNGLFNQSTERSQEIMNLWSNGVEDDGTIHTDYTALETSEMFSTSFVKNNLTSFKHFLDSPESGIAEYLGENGIVYTYDVNFDVYTYNREGEIQNTDADVRDITSSGKLTAMSGGMTRMRQSMLSFRNGSANGALNFSEMAAGRNGQVISPIVMENYDLVNGKWPEKYDEVVLVMSTFRTLPAETLYQLGIMTGDEYLAAGEAVENGEEPERINWSYEQLIGKTFYLVTPSDHYIQNENGGFTYIDDSIVNMDKLLEQAVELKITGIIMPAEDANVTDINTAIGYTSKLTDYCIQHANESAAAKAQMENPDINVLTGARFNPESVDEKAEDAANYIRTLSDIEKAQLYLVINYLTAGETAKVGEIETAASADDETVSESSKEESAMAAGDSTGTSSGDSAGTASGDSAGTASGDSAGTASGDSAGTAAGDSVGTASGDSAGTASGDSSGSAAEMTPENLQALMQMYGIKDPSDLSSYAEVFGEDTVNSWIAALTAGAGGEKSQSALLDEWLDSNPDKELLASLFDEYEMGGSYDDNMAEFGLVSYDAPVSINIYTDTFEAKDKITAAIDRYNKECNDEDKIVYTDYIALITSSVTQMVDAISYVLIAFVAISLIVSSIMIGIITHISVMERTKEIGILRAMGASKKNISYVFNAETVIIGLLSGLIGIIISMLLSIPINMILKFLLGSEMISVGLPIIYGIILILISMAVTVIGGLIPSAKAAKKDPVIALRTE